MQDTSVDDSGAICNEEEEEFSKKDEILELAEETPIQTLQSSPEDGYPKETNS
jgi:hypothetical protein